MTKNARACCSLALVAFSNSGGITVTSAFTPILLRRWYQVGRPSTSITSTLVSPRLEFSRRFFMSSSNSNTSNEATPTPTATTEALVDVADNLQFVRDKIQATCDAVQRPVDTVRLVAVSKTKPLELLRQAYYDASQRIFGENYVQELTEKAGQMPPDVEWHFIGSLQSNKANVLVKSVVPVSAKLVVETVSSIKLANKLNSAMEALDNNDTNSDSNKKLSIFIQVNTSGEDSKSGIEPSQVIPLAKEILESCPRLELQGLMTIGAPGDLTCFDTLIQCRNELAAELGLPTNHLELSMGMSDDFQAAIQKGATNIRIGSTIFGARDYSKN